MGEMHESSASVPSFEVAGKSAYLIGIGGCGMSGLARMLQNRGATVSGSDSTPSDVTAALVDAGFEIGFDQSRQWLPDACDLVVASAAVRPEHPQVLEAARRGIQVLYYAEALGKCMLGRTGIAVAGTHGKSTTTAMLGAALTDAGLDPTVIVGATCPQLVRGCLWEPADFREHVNVKAELSTNQGPDAATLRARGAVGFRIGANDIPAGAMRGSPGLLVAEACEFNRSFHNLHPTIACITSVEADHLDVYGSLDEIVLAFHEFAKLIPPAAKGGKLLIAHDGAHRREVTAGLECEVETIGFSPAADWVVGYEKGARHVTLAHKGEHVAAWDMRIPGAHNAVNAATAMVLAIYVGADADTLARSLARFGGVDRRSQMLGERAHPHGGTIRVYDDYGHHPTEIEVTLRGLRDFERPEERGGRLICVFQPHQHSRTRFLLEEFANSFSSADVVIVPHIYFVRDSQEEKHKVTASDLVDRLRSRGVRAMHLYPFEAIVEQLENLCRGGDMLVVMGAGPVNEVAHGYLAGAPAPGLAARASSTQAG